MGREAGNAAKELSPHFGGGPVAISGCRGGGAAVGPLFRHLSTLPWNW